MEIWNSPNKNQASDQVEANILSIMPILLYPHPQNVAGKIPIYLSICPELKAHHHPASTRFRCHCRLFGTSSLRTPCATCRSNQCLSFRNGWSQDERNDTTTLFSRSKAERASLHLKAWIMWGHVMNPVLPELGILVLRWYFGFVSILWKVLTAEFTSQFDNPDATNYLLIPAGVATAAHLRGSSSLQSTLKCPCGENTEGNCALECGKKSVVTYTWMVPLCQTRWVIHNPPARVLWAPSTNEATGISLARYKLPFVYFTQYQLLFHRMKGFHN